MRSSLLLMHCQVLFFIPNVAAWGEQTHTHSSLEDGTALVLKWLHFSWHVLRSYNPVTVKPSTVLFWLLCRLIVKKSFDLPYTKTVWCNKNSTNRDIPNFLCFPVQVKIRVGVPPSNSFDLLALFGVRASFNNLLISHMKPIRHAKPTTLVIWHFNFFIKEEDHFG